MTDTRQAGESTIAFGGLDIAFDHRVLQPRPWTVRQSVWAEELLTQAPPGDVLELCSGAGHIGLRAVAHHDRHLVMVDVDPVACAFARSNAAAAKMADRVEVRQLPIDDAVRPTELFSVIIADPPWVPTAETTTFPEDPLLAIDGGDDGLRIAHMCVRTAGDHLLEGGSLLIQLGTAEQAAAVCVGTRFEVEDLLTEPGRGVVALLVPRPER